MRPETPQNRPQYHRLRRIIAMVREGMAGGRLPNRSDFRRELEVSPRTLARDLDFLRDEERAPIAYEPARHGYRLTDATYDLPPVNLSRREVFSFSLARKMLHAFEGTPLEMDMRSTLDKIAASLEGTFAVSLDALTEHMSVQTEDRVVIDPAIARRHLHPRTYLASQPNLPPSPRRLAGDADRNLRAQGTRPLGALVDAGCRGAGTAKPARPCAREAS